MRKFLLIVPLALGFCSCETHHYYIPKKQSTTNTNTYRTYRSSSSSSEPSVSVSASQDNGSYVEGIR